MLYALLTGLVLGMALQEPVAPISITQHGNVTAHNVGDAIVSATYNNITATRTVAVSSSAAVVKTVDVVIHRFSEGTDTVLVSSGFPLMPGLVTPATLDNFRLIINEKEIAIFVEPLYGKHLDGSYRSVLVQFPMKLTPETPLTGRIEFGPQGKRLANTDLRAYEQERIALGHSSTAKKQRDLRRDLGLHLFDKEYRNVIARRF
jgi:hypothetical protein